jgi:hypothetical protein
MRRVDIDVIAPNVFQHADSEAGVFFSNDIKVRTKGDLLILEVDGIDYQYNVADEAVVFNGTPYTDVPTLITDLAIAGYANFNSGGVSPQYVDIDLTSSSYDILNYGVYEVKLGNIGGTYTMNMPAAENFAGKTIRIINASNQEVVFGGAPRFNRGTATSVVRLTVGQYSQFVSINGKWRGFVL